MQADLAHTVAVTVDPGEADRARAEAEAEAEELRQLEERGRQENEYMSDWALIGAMGKHPLAVNAVEMNRRLKDAVNQLTAELKAFRTSSDKLATMVVWLTVLLVILTLVLVALTVVTIVTA